MTRIISNVSIFQQGTLYKICITFIHCHFFHFLFLLLGQISLTSKRTMEKMVIWGTSRQFKANGKIEYTKYFCEIIICFRLMDKIRRKCNYHQWGLSQIIEWLMSCLRKKNTFSSLKLFLVRSCNSIELNQTNIRWTYLKLQIFCRKYCASVNLALASYSCHGCLQNWRSSREEAKVVQKSK